MIIEESSLSGIGHYTYELVKRFALENSEFGHCHQIIVFCRANARHHFIDIIGIDIHTISLKKGRVSRVLAEQFRLPLVMRRKGVNAVLNPAFTGPTWGAETIVTTVHDLYHKVVPHLMPFTQRLFLSFAMPICCCRSQVVVTTSKSTANDLKRFYPYLRDKIRIVPMANRLVQSCLSSRPQRGSEHPQFVLLVASLTGNKNPGALVAALARVRERYSDIQLVHVGDDPNGLLETAVLRHDARNWVVRKARISDAELTDLYRECLCFAIPSLYEGFGLPMLEAQGQGAPVISSDRAALPEVGGDGALYFHPCDVGEIADAIVQLIASPCRREELRQAGWANQARFSWDKTAYEMFAILMGKPSSGEPETA